MNIHFLCVTVSSANWYRIQKNVNIHFNSEYLLQNEYNLAVDIKKGHRTSQEDDAVFKGLHLDNRAVDCPIAPK